MKKVLGKYTKYSRSDITIAVIAMILTVFKCLHIQFCKMCIQNFTEIPYKRYFYISFKFTFLSCSTCFIQNGVYYLSHMLRNAATTFSYTVHTQSHMHKLCCTL